MIEETSSLSTVSSSTISGVKPTLKDASPATNPSSPAEPTAHSYAPASPKATASKSGGLRAKVPYKPSLCQGNRKEVPIISQCYFPIALLISLESCKCS
jgi:hypothetical protein